jgi:hypothetical protein
MRVTYRCAHWLMSAYANVLFLISRPEALEGRLPSTWVRTIILAASLCGSGTAPMTFPRGMGV